jgi:hypothetical protein
MIAGHVADESFFCKKRDPKSPDATNVAKLSALVDRRNPERAKALAEDAARKILARNRETVGALAELLNDFGALSPRDIEQVLDYFPITRCSIPEPTARPAAPPPIDRAPAEVELHHRTDGWIGGTRNGRVRALAAEIRRRDERQALYDAAASNVLGAFEG